MRLLRQEIAVLCRLPDARKALLRRRLASEVQFYDRGVRRVATKDQATQVDALAHGASAAFNRGGNADLDLASEMIRQIDRLYWSHGFDQIEFCINCYRQQREKRYLAIDPSTFDSLVQEGDAALASGDGQTVRRILFEVLMAQRNVGSDSRAPERAWLMRA